MLIQMKPPTLEETPKTIQIREEKLIVFVEGRKLYCFNCGKLGSVRAECNSPGEEVEQEGEGEITEINRNNYRNRKQQING